MTAKLLANDAHGIKALLGWLGDHAIARIVFEPTGPYHHRLERQLGEAGLPLAKVNLLQARRFAQAAGTQSGQGCCMITSTATPMNDGASKNWCKQGKQFIVVV